MSFLGNGSGAGSGAPGDDPKKPSPARIGVWIVVSAVALYMIGSGVIGIVSGG